jgi:hypothetical protein
MSVVVPEAPSQTRPPVHIDPLVQVEPWPPDVPG